LYKSWSPGVGRDQSRKTIFTRTCVYIEKKNLLQNQ
jgi:hypothetical protein